jgi:hypothetical protein
MATRQPRWISGDRAAADYLGFLSAISAHTRTLASFPRYTHLSRSIRSREVPFPWELSKPWQAVGEWGRRGKL